MVVAVVGEMLAYLLMSLIVLTDLGMMTDLSLHCECDRCLDKTQVTGHEKNEHWDRRVCHSRKACHPCAGTMLIVCNPEECDQRREGLFHLMNLLFSPSSRLATEVVPTSDLVTKVTSQQRRALVYVGDIWRAETGPPSVCLASARSAVLSIFWITRDSPSLRHARQRTRL
ncbi:hypothetical protein PAXRUDRAFT_696112 [Paxillus rubicundulus Ve08.2h10]|uniref:C2H2-type domain-containing protein n=1 Tax=Paxillus rubicundulus Ve08.2h10 TaxID=930991 RepID=A0A0D0DJ14_9AGAM|nr:hypothetical protein PAXRUDRAFT_696112 [Paxillus rubicundulus Ve08.2h10]